MKKKLNALEKARSAIKKADHASTPRSIKAKLKKKVSKRNPKAGSIPS